MYNSAWNTLTPVLWSYIQVEEAEIKQTQKHLSISVVKAMQEYRGDESRE